MLKDKDDNLLSNNTDNNLDYKPSIKPCCNKSSNSDNDYVTFFSSLFIK